MPTSSSSSPHVWVRHEARSTERRAPVVPDDVRRLMHTHSRVGSRKGYLFQLFAGAGWSSIPGLPFLRQQTLILAGDDDPIIPLVNARIMQRLIPNARLHVYPDGHLGLVTSAKTLAPLIANFLGRD